MQLLGVINQPYPPEGINPEEYQAHTVNVCAGEFNLTLLVLDRTGIPTIILIRTACSYFFAAWHNAPPCTWKSYFFCSNSHSS